MKNWLNTLWRKYVGMSVMVRDFDGDWMKKRAYLLSRDEDENVSFYVKFGGYWQRMDITGTFPQSERLREWKHRI